MTDPARTPAEDARVEAAAKAMFELPGIDGDYTWAQMVTEDESRAYLWRDDARRVLAAASVQAPVADPALREQIANALDDATSKFGTGFGATGERDALVDAVLPLVAGARDARGGDNVERLEQKSAALIEEARKWPRDGINEGPLINALADALAAAEARAMPDRQVMIERMIEVAREDAEFDPTWDYRRDAERYIDAILAASRTEGGE